MLCELKPSSWALCEVSPSGSVCFKDPTPRNLINSDTGELQLPAVVFVIFSYKLSLASYQELIHF